MPARRPRSRVGLALAGGGPPGGMYELGALCALEEVVRGFDATAMTRYVGVSAGAIVSAALVAGRRRASSARTGMPDTRHPSPD